MNIDIPFDSLGFRILAILVVGSIVLMLLRLFARNLIRAVILHSPITTERPESEREQRVAMLSRVLSHSIIVSTVIIVGLLVLGELDVNLAPLLAGAGVVGIAIGFGAQSLVKDFFAGFFIVYEDQFAVGDVIKVGEISGRVEAFTLRRTVLRDMKGLQHHVPNGQIDVVSNYTKDYSSVNFEIIVDVDENFERIREIIDEIGKRMAGEDEFADGVMTVPHVLGMKNIDGRSMVVTILGKMKPGAHWAFKREMRRRIHERFRQEGVRHPYVREISRKEE